MIARKPTQFVASGGIEARSDDQRTGIARRSPDIGIIEQAYTSAGDRLIAGGPPHDARWTPDDARDDARTMNPMSGARRAITRKKTSAADRTVLNFVNHRTADGSDVSSLPDACRSDTSAGDRIICK
ncbi:hypothetical protein DPMN_034027 [Dreissena polymorpha]|uniref:Uncharacterized protein n=1 Tax=Dreissena polymorpha TaxID=45954 RepID=A0A9D4M9F1_DREPO|nr:hypothetical protein DPMN_034027 [Dreissena polymorpha]